MNYLICFLFIIVFNTYGQIEFTVADIYSSAKFYSNSIKNIHWKKDGSGVVYRKAVKYRTNRDFYFYEFDSKKNFLMIKGSEINKNEEYDTFVDANVIWSPDEKYILFTSKLPARDVKSGGDFFLFNISNKKLIPFNNSGPSKMLAQFSPDSKYIGYVKENNLFIANIETSDEIQLTFDGNENILNGHFDWVYEEEFDIIEGWCWSPDSKHIAFWQMDQTDVKEFEIPLFNDLYPKNRIQKYPKAGQKNSRIKIGVVDVNSKQTQWYTFENDSDFYIPRIHWLPDAQSLAFIKLNRLQNHLEIYLADIKNKSINKIFEEKDNRWIEIKDDLRFLKLSDLYVWTSEQDGYRHIYLNNYKNSQNIQVTKGDWEVREVCAVDEIKHKIYFSATKESELENHVYSVNFDGSSVTKLSKSKGWHDVNFSPGGQYYFDKYSDVSTPIKYNVHNNLGEILTILEKNEMEILDNYNLGKSEFIKIAVDDVQLNAWILKPENFDSDNTYPLMIYTYGGPGSQKVINKWGSISYWFRLLTQKGIIVACIDNRGTEGRGAEFKKYVYKKLGQLDVKDQIEAARYLANLDYIDQERIGIYGWSYGGYMSLMCLMQGSKVFKLAVSVAPVTDWRFYDTIYTESFMQTPQINKEGYEFGSVMNYASLLEDQLLLIHGMADDNVHFQNSVELVKELVKQNKQFDVQFYPNTKHGIRGLGSYTRENVYTKITNFILEKL